MRRSGTIGGPVIIPVPGPVGVTMVPIIGAIRPPGVPAVRIPGIAVIIVGPPIVAVVRVPGVSAVIIGIRGITAYPPGAAGDQRAQNRRQKAEHQIPMLFHHHSP